MVIWFESAIWKKKKEVVVSNPFDVFDFSEEEAEEVIQEVARNPYNRDGAICLCGHPRSKHMASSIGYTCSPAKQFCPCKKLRVVAESSDTRYFLRKTLGAGPRHALSQGMKAAVKSGATVVWVGESSCDKCGEEKPVSPVPVTQGGIEMDEPTGFDVLLCIECRMGLGSTAPTLSAVEDLDV